MADDFWTKDSSADNADSLLHACLPSLFAFTAFSHVPVLTAAVFFTVCTALINPIFALCLGKMFQTFTDRGNGNLSGSLFLMEASRYAAQLATLGGISWVCNAAFLFFWMTFAELQAKNARKRLFEQLLTRELVWFDMRGEGMGAFLANVHKQIRELQIATAQPLGLSIQYSIRAISAVVLAFVISWKLTLVTLATLPLTCIALIMLGTKMKLFMNQQQEELTEASKLIHDAFSSIEVVKCFNAQFRTYWRFLSCIRVAAHLYHRVAAFSAFQLALVRFVTFSMFVQGFWFGSKLVRTSDLTAGQVLTTFWVCLIAIQAIETATEHTPALERGKIAAATLQSYLRSQKWLTQTPDASLNDVFPDIGTKNIVLSRVSFAYPLQSSPVLQSASLIFPAGKTTFIVGRSGAGKSTVLNLLLRFYRPTTGDIFIGDAPLELINLYWLRKNITLVHQNSLLFNETLLENIMLGAGDMMEDTVTRVDQALTTANLHGTVRHLPQGLHTLVGEGGSALSGGQRQRVAIARARMRDTPVLILDEPTSALDAKNRTVIMDAIRTWRQGKTTIIITHDSANILPGDLVYVMDGGRTVAFGSKSQLMERNLWNFATDDGRRSVSGSQSSLEGSQLSSHILEESYLSPGNQQDTHSPEISGNNSLQEDSILNCYMTEPPPTATSFSSGDHSSSRPIIPEPERMSRSSQPASIGSSNTIRFWLSKLSATQPPGGQSAEPQLSLFKTVLTAPSVLKQQQQWLLGLAVTCALFHSASMPVFSYMLSQLFRSFYAEENRAQVAKKWSTAMLGLAMGDSVVTFTLFYLLDYCGQAWMDYLRDEAMRRTLDQPRQWFEEKEHSPLQLTACFDQNAEGIRNFLGKFVGLSLVALFTVLITLCWSFTLCWKLTLISLACGPVVLAISKGFEVVNRKWESESSRQQGAVADVFSEAFTDIRTVRSYLLEDRFRLRHAHALRDAIRIGLCRGGFSGIFFGLGESAIIFISALLFYYGAVLLAGEEFGVTDIITVFAMVLFSIGYVITIISWVPQVNSAYDAAARLIQLSRLPYASSYEHTGRQRRFELFPIKFNRVNFRYPQRPDVEVLRDVSITIPPNSCVALVGCSGSGKSTIISLLLGLYPTTTGGPHVPPAITFGGTDITRIHLPTLRSQIAVVPQHPYLFADTIRANITYGLDPTSRLNTAGNVIAAAEAAGIDEFIRSLPQGYMTPVGAGGMTLSGGQAQRVVIARALVRRPQVLILDEATSNLDAESAEVIRQTVQRLRCVPQLTVILITHAREMMQMADRVVMMDQGMVVEEGTYESLLGRPFGRLREMLSVES